MPTGACTCPTAMASKSPVRGSSVSSPAEGELWCGTAFNFANGLAIAPDGCSLLVAETFANRVVRIAIREDGSAGDTEVVATLTGFLPDGLAFDAVGNLYVGCYEPSAILRVGLDGAVCTL